MNRVLHSSSETAFWLSMNVSSSVHIGNFIFDFVDETISSADGSEQENVVQVVTDNVSNNMATTKLLTLRGLIFSEFYVHHMPLTYCLRTS